MSARGREWRQAADPIEAARGRVQRRLDRMFADAVTEPYDDMVHDRSDSIDPDADLMPGYRYGAQAARDPETRAALRDLLETMAVVLDRLRGAQRKVTHNADMITVVAVTLFAGFGTGAAVVAVIQVLR